MTHATTDAAEARAREALAQAFLDFGHPHPARHIAQGRELTADQPIYIAAMLSFATAEAASGAGEREELAAFGASEAAGYQYPGGNQAAERAAFCAGAAHAASLPPAADPAMVTVLRQALEDVCDPLSYLQRKAEAEGSRLNGMAYTIANDIATVQRIARAALAAAPTIPATGEAKNDPA